MNLILSSTYEFVVEEDSTDKSSLDLRIIKLLNKMKNHYQERILYLKDDKENNIDKINAFQAEIVDIISLLVWIEQKK